MQTALFLGAGASSFVHQPTTEGLLNNLVRKHRSDPLIADILSNQELKDKDIEILYNYIEKELLCEQSNLINKMQYKLPDGKIFSGSSIMQEIHNLQSSIRDLLLQSFKFEPEDSRQVLAVYEKLEDFIKDQGDNELKIITTNYDLIIEESYAQIGRQIINGFLWSPSHRKGYWRNKWKCDSNDDNSNPIRLVKLHGSISWHREDNGENEIVELGGVGYRNMSHDIMIMPTLTKKDYTQQPFSSLTEQFKNILNKIDVLIIIGYSYRDNELNAMIKERLSNGLVVISISPRSNQEIKSIDNKRRVLERTQISLLNTRIKSRTYSYNVMFSDETIDDICDVLKHVYNHLNVDGQT